VEGHPELKKIRIECDPAVTDGLEIEEPLLVHFSASDGMSQTLMAGERPPPDTRETGNWYRKNWAFEFLTVVGPNLGYEPCRGPFRYGPGRTENRCDQFHFWSLHPGGGNFLFADGSVHFISYAGAEIMPALATRSGGEIVSLP
jgi:prepilin-type processing-associated H-X9-DG protein